jgi:hypothetical protein
MLLNLLSDIFFPLLFIGLAGFTLYFTITSMQRHIVKKKEELNAIDDASSSEKVFVFDEIENLIDFNAGTTNGNNEVTQEEEIEDSFEELSEDSSGLDDLDDLDMDDDVVMLDDMDLDDGDLPDVDDIDDDFEFDNDDFGDEESELTDGFDLDGDLDDMSLDGDDASSDDSGSLDDELDFDDMSMDMDDSDDLDLDLENTASVDDVLSEEEPTEENRLQKLKSKMNSENEENDDKRVEEEKAKAEAAKVKEEVVMKERAEARKSGDAKKESEPEIDLAEDSGDHALEMDGDEIDNLLDGLDLD